ncbi:MAG: FadR family transcriptional regulator, partial [Anaerolineales bacterium]
MAKHIKPVPRTTLARTVAARLVSLIADGTFKAGDKLPPERELAKQLEVGRSTIREALQSLALMNLVDVQPGRGTFVNKIDRAAATQIEEMIKLAQQPTT